MERTQRNAIIRDLKAKGFKRVDKFPFLYLNHVGVLYSLREGKTLKLRAKNNVFIENQYLSVPKLLLLVFKNEPIRENQHIRYIDGNSKNLTPNNVEYVRKYKNGQINEVNSENLRTVIRCYFAVEKRYNVRDRLLTRLYLSDILNKRVFYIHYSTRKNIDVFQSYIENINGSVKDTARKCNLNFRDVQYIVNDFLNLLISDILADLQACKLSVLEYQKRRTKTDMIKQANEYLKENGLKPLPLRKKSQRETINSFRKFTNELNNPNQ